MKRLSAIALIVFGILSAKGEDGFMSEHWSQTKPYNDLVPAYLPPETGDTGYEAWGGHVTAGCVATAMAQTMHYWNWPARFDKAVTVSQSVNLDKGKTVFGVEHQIASGAPLVYDDSDECKARLTFIAATLGELAFDRDGTGGYPSTVANALSDYYVAPPTCDDYYLCNYLKLGYPVPATITGHAVVLHGWKQDEKGNDLYYMNNGQGGSGDRWIDRATIKSLSPCFPKKMVMIDPIPAKAKLPLTVEWSFPEAYLKIYPKEFEGFTIKAIPSSAKDQPEVDVQLGREERSYTFDKLTNGETYSIEITPRFGTLAEDDPTVFIEPIMQSAMMTIDDGAGECPQLTAPKKYFAALSGGEFKITGSKTIEKIGVTPSLKSYTINKTTYDLSKYISIEGKEGDFTVKIAPIDFLSKSDNYNVVFTFAGTAQDGSVAYAETIVTFSASGEVVTPTEPEDPDPVKLADYILISPKDFVADWEKYVERRKIAHPELTFAVKNAAEIYEAYKDLNPSEKIKEYIRSQAQKGTKYFVLGGAWSDPATIEKSEISFVTGDGKSYGQTVLSLSNTIPGWYHPYNAGSAGIKTVASDYDYALISGDDQIPDVVIARIPLVRWPDEKTGAFPSFSEIIEGYGEKVAAVEAASFTGNHHFALAAGQLVGKKDGKTDGEIAASFRFEQYFKSYSLEKEPPVVPVNETAADFFDSKIGWEAVIAKCHGLENSAYGTGIDDNGFARTDTLVKFGIFAMPCLTGRPDVTATFAGMTNCLKPSMGIAAICNPKGGEVVGFHNNHDGAGSYDIEKVTKCEDPYATQYEGCLLNALCKERLNAGEAWLKAHQDYCRNIGTGTWHMYTMHNSILYGDPLLKMSDPLKTAKLPKVLFR